MSTRSLLVLAISGLLVCVGPPAFAAKNLKITIPWHSELTPVQRLNRKGVDALLKQRYENAEGLFYKAYLYDPADPFTLNNLGYVAELQGQVDRAERFYKLAAEQGCYATISLSSVKSLDGKPMMDALGTLKSSPMRVNRLDFIAMQLLSQDRGFEADAVLKQALAIDPNNAFTLNDLGVAMEATGDLESALKYYDAAADSRSKEPVIVTRNRAWRGKPVSEMAADSAKNLRKRMLTMNVAQIRSNMLAIRGVEEINQNDWSAARKDFIEAYALDPQSAFSLNNRGYVAERGGDFETAKAYYEQARDADDANARIGLATQTSAQGQPLAIVADASHQNMGLELDEDIQEHRGKKNSFELKRRSQLTEKPEPSPNSSSTDTPQPGSPTQTPPQ